MFILFTSNLFFPYRVYVYGSAPEEYRKSREFLFRIIFSNTNRPVPVHAPPPPPQPQTLSSPPRTDLFQRPRYGYLGMDWDTMRPIPGHYMNRQP